MLFNIPCGADWHKIGEHMQALIDRGNQRKNNWHSDYNYKVGDKVLIEKQVSSIKQSLNMARSHGL